MKTPEIKSIDTALQIYYSYAEIGNKEIRQLFNGISKSTINKLKKVAINQMIAQEVYSHGQYTINTAIAFESWGIDVNDLEERKNKIKSLNLRDNRIAG